MGPGRLLSCAHTETRDELYWHVEGDDPDRWPIVFRDEEGSSWVRHDLSLVGFLPQVFTGALDPRGYGSAGYLSQPPTFVPNPWRHPIESFCAPAGRNPPGSLDRRGRVSDS